MMSVIRKGRKDDLSSVAEIYEKILTKQDRGDMSIGWVRGVYPTLSTAEAALAADDLFVMEADGKIVGSCRINREQVREYADCTWSTDAPEDQVMVLHTLTIDPEQSGKGFGKQFVAYYEQYARAQGCPFLRMDTNVINSAARAMYRKLGYREAGIVDSFFNGIPDVKLVCLEKTLETNTIEVVAALIWQNDRFLICQRPENKSRPLLWEFPGGKVEPGETKEAAILRECREELDCDLTLGEVFYDVVHAYPERSIHLTLFHCFLRETPPKALEHHDLRWVQEAELKNFPFCPADQEIIDANRGKFIRPSL